jgi:hypothetical protein
MNSLDFWDITLCSLVKANISEENVSIFRVEEYAKQETSMKFSLLPALR